MHRHLTTPHPDGAPGHYMALADFGATCGDAEGAANARLAAAGPDMLAALQQIAELTGGDSVAADIARAAIMKVEAE